MAPLKPCLVCSMLAASLEAFLASGMRAAPLKPLLGLGMFKALLKHFLALGIFAAPPKPCLAFDMFAAPPEPFLALGMCAAPLKPCLVLYLSIPSALSPTKASDDQQPKRVSSRYCIFQSLPPCPLPKHLMTSSPSAYPRGVVSFNPFRPVPTKASYDQQPKRTSSRNCIFEVLYLSIPSAQSPTKASDDQQLKRASSRYCIFQSLPPCPLPKHLMTSRPSTYPRGIVCFNPFRPLPYQSIV